MKKRFLLMVILMAFVTPANAQDGKSPYFRRFEIGWDVLSYWREGNSDLVGANFSFAVRKSDRLAFVAEYAAHSGVFAEDIISSYHFGPRYYAKPRGRLQPFIEILAGGTHLNQSPSGSLPQDSTDRNGFSLLAGGGLDLRIKPWFAWRIVQTDYSFFHIAGDSSNGLRVDTGILFRFGH